MEVREGATVSDFGTVKGVPCGVGEGLARCGESEPAQGGWRSCRGVP